MRVKLNEDYGAFANGDTHELPDLIAADLVQQGKAIPVTQDACRCRGTDAPARCHKAVKPSQMNRKGGLG